MRLRATCIVYLYDMIPYDVFTIDYDTIPVLWPPLLWGRAHSWNAGFFVIDIVQPRTFYAMY